VAPIREPNIKIREESIMDNIKTITYRPMGTDHALQRKITNLMQSLVTAQGLTTLGELGYLHMNSVTFVEDHLELKAYFLPEIMMIGSSQINGRIRYVPDPRLEVFGYFMFVGSLADSISIESVSVPKYKIVVDELGQKAVVVKGPRRTDEEEDVAVLHCNLSLTMAAAHGINLNDPNFKVTYDTVATGAKAKKGAPPVVVSTVGLTNEYPVTLHIQYTDTGEKNRYDPQDAIPYLLAKAQSYRDAKMTQRELAQKISDDAAHLDKKRYKKQFKNYEKYR